MFGASSLNQPSYVTYYLTLPRPVLIIKGKHLSFSVQRPKSPQTAQNRRIWPSNVRFTLTKMTIVNQTQLTPSCFGYDKAALSAPSLVEELSVTLRDLPYTLLGGLASNAAPRRYNLRIVTDIAIVGPRTLVTAGA